MPPYDKKIWVIAKIMMRIRNMELGAKWYPIQFKIDKNEDNRNSFLQTDPAEHENVLT